jgi:hypothetical protein
MGKINKSTEKTTFDASDYVFGWLNSEAEGSERKTKWSVIATGIATYLGITNFGSGKIITAAERTKLNGIATGAQVNVVTAVHGRTGAVVAAASDYDANQIDFNDTATPDITATEVQDAIEKVYARTELSQDLTPQLGGNLDPQSFAWTGTLKHTGSLAGFYNTSPISKPAALTAQLTTITQAGSFTPDYTIQAMTNTTPYGFVTADEAETVLSVISNLQIRVAELESRIQSLGLMS